MKPIRFFRTFVTACILIAFGNMPVFALSTDRDQPAEIEADDIEFDFKNGTRTYINNVLVIQGSLRIKADKVVANYGEKDLEKATAWGSLARFKQRPDGKPDDTEGWAKKIVVDQVKNTITLVGKAALKQGPNTARGDTIVYNTVTEKMRILGGSKGGSKVQAAGKDGQAPKRKLEDPFKDDNEGPPEATAAKPKPKTKKASDESDDKVDDDGAESSAKEDEPTTAEPKPVPTKSGRSRLIIQPK